MAQRGRYSSAVRSAELNEILNMCGDELKIARERSVPKLNVEFDPVLSTFICVDCGWEGKAPTGATECPNCRTDYNDA